ncbi:MAG: thioredoxin-disulfide reductase [Bacteroidetes bacterium]|nr:thioredoxin-disulfide reductase [Bacteroidota bacterium]
MNTNPERVQCLIVGSGPAGYTAAIYAARAELKPMMYMGPEPGGQLTTTTEVENYPGYPKGIQGPEMMELFKAQAERFKTDVRFGFATKVDLTGPVHKVWIDDGKVEIHTDTLIIATGASAKWIGLESEQKYRTVGGVSACAVCDGFFYRGKDVAIVGAGDTACEEATYLAKLCKQVYMIVRKANGEMRASKAMQTRVMNTKNIEVLWESETKEVLGDESGVNGAVVVNKKTGEERRLDIFGFFVAIGHKPNTDIFNGWLDMDESGYIKTIPGSSRTNIPGVFAVGDAQDKVYRQAVTAAGSGCMGALDAERYLASRGVH